MKSTLQSVNSILIQGSHSSSGKMCEGVKMSTVLIIMMSLALSIGLFLNIIRKLQKKKKENFSNMTEGESVRMSKSIT